MKQPPATTRRHMRRHLRSWRALADLSQTEVAIRLGVSTNEYSRMERGYSPITDDRLPKLARILNVDPHVMQEVLSGGAA